MNDSDKVEAEVDRSPKYIENWFQQAPIPSHQGLISVIIKIFIGLLIASLLWYLGWQTLAYIGATLAVVIGLMSLISPTAKTWIERIFTHLGTLLGRGLGIVTLTPIYFVIFPLIRVYDFLIGRDPMGWRHSSASMTYWHPADDHIRVKAAITRTFLTDALSTKKRGGISSLVFLLVGAILICEIILRVMGFGDPVLYQNDMRYGYRPASHQQVNRQGNLIEINEWGMRAPELNEQKPKNVIRILMLGDSTLWGGSYTTQKRLYARQVEGLINERLSNSSHRVEVLNMGVNGWGPEHKLGYLKTYGHFDTDIAVVTFPFADLRRPLSYLQMTPFYPVNSPPLLALQEILYHLTWRIRGHLIGVPSQAQKELNLDRGIEAYARLAEALHHRGAELWYEMLPSRPSVEDRLLPREERYVSMISKRLDILPFKVNFNFAREALVKGYQDQINSGSIYHDFGHLNPDGHDIYARYLAERLLTSAHLSKLLDQNTTGGQR